MNPCLTRKVVESPRTLKKDVPGLVRRLLAPQPQYSVIESAIGFLRFNTFCYPLISLRCLGLYGVGFVRYDHVTCQKQAKKTVLHLSFEPFPFRHTLIELLCRTKI